MLLVYTVRLALEKGDVRPTHGLAFTLLRRSPTSSTVFAAKDRSSAEKAWMLFDRLAIASVAPPNRRAGPAREGLLL